MREIKNGHRSVTTWLWEEDYQLLEVLSRKAGLSKASYLRGLIHEHIQARLDAEYFSRTRRRKRNEF